MATIKAAYDTNDKRVVVTWANAANGDTIESHEVRGKPDFAVVQFEGAFTGATATLTGSLSNVAYQGLRDKSNTIISTAANAIFSVQEPTIYWKPTVTSAGADTVTTTLTYWIR